MAITDYIETTSKLLTQTKARLETLISPETVLPWTVELFSGTSSEKLWEHVPELLIKNGCAKPVAVIYYTGSTFQNLPRRTANISVLVMVDNGDYETGSTSARTYLDRCLALLDDYVYNQATWFARGDQAVDVAPNLETYKVDFEIKDH